MPDATLRKEDMGPVDGIDTNIREEMGLSSKSSADFLPSAVDNDSASGSENGERPVRKKLQETDLDESGMKAQDQIFEGGNLSSDMDHPQAAVQRKRSLENFNSFDDQYTPDATHSRKRSRDARPKDKNNRNAARSAYVNTEMDAAKEGKASGDESHDMSHAEVVATPPSSGDEGVRRSPKRKRSDDDMDLNKDSDRDRKVAATEKSRARRSSSEGVDDDRGLATFAQSSGNPDDSGRNVKDLSETPEDKTGTKLKLTKKRSRDKLDEEFEREQKKTSSARHSQIRGSVEAGADNVHAQANQDSSTSTNVSVSSGVGIAQMARKEAASNLGPSSAAESIKSEAPSESSLVETPTALSSNRPDNNATSTATSKQLKSSSQAQDLPHTSEKAFAASGFAAMAGQKSPFGALGTGPTMSSEEPGKDASSQPSSSTFASSGFASMTGTTSPFGAAGSQPSSGFSFGSNPRSLPGFGSTNASSLTSASPFASSGTRSGFGALGSSSFGSGFGSGFGGGSRLTSFAAPVGDASLGSAAASKPFGAPAEGEDEEDDEVEEEEDGATTRDNREESEVRSEELSDPAAQSEQSRKFKIRDGKPIHCCATAVVPS